MSETGDGGRRRGGLFDDLAGMAGGAFSVLAGLRQEVEAMARSQVEAMVQRLELVRREELDAALEVARRAREAAEALEARVASLEARLGIAAAGGAEGTSGTTPMSAHPGPEDGKVPEGDPAAEASAGKPDAAPEDKAG